LKETDQMSKKIISAKAGWVPAEIAPIGIMVIIAILGAILGLLGFFSKEGAIAMGTIAGLLAVWLVFENSRRKKNSQIFAEFSENGDMEVWMTKPIKGKWGDVLSHMGRNKVNLDRLISVAFKGYGGTPAVTLVSDKPNSIAVVPLRLIVDAPQELRDIFLERIDFSKIAYAEKGDKTQFTSVLGGGVADFEYKKREVQHPTEEWKREPKRQKAVIVEDAPEVVLDANVADMDVRVEPVTDGPLNVTQVIGYDAYREKTSSELITDALAKAEQDALDKMRD
jgi:hypothetical protein